jgi:hypothetical protein
MTTRGGQNNSGKMMTQFKGVGATDLGADPCHVGVTPSPGSRARCLSVYARYQCSCCRQIGPFFEIKFKRIYL